MRSGGHPQRAMMDLGAKFRASSFHNHHWNRPRLDSSSGIHNNGRFSGKPQVWTVDFPGSKDKSKTWEISQFIYKKRGDGKHQYQYLTAIQIEYYDGKSWQKYQNGKWLPTNAKREDPFQKERTITLDPPITGATKVRINLDRAHNSDNSFSGRFDWMIAPEK